MTAEHGEELPADPQEVARRALRRLIGRGGSLYRLVPISAEDASRSITDPASADQLIAALPADAAVHGNGYLLATESRDPSDTGPPDGASPHPGALPGPGTGTSPDGHPSGNPGTHPGLDGDLDADVQQLLARIQTTGSRLSTKGL